MLAAQGIALGDIDVAVAGGMESMSNAPYLLSRAREGLRMGDASLIDSMIHDGLWCAFEHATWGVGRASWQKLRRAPRGAGLLRRRELTRRRARAAAAGDFASEMCRSTSLSRRARLLCSIATRRSGPIRRSTCSKG
jgi:acetyl-CoA C-acetyltransferase